MCPLVGETVWLPPHIMGLAVIPIPTSSGHRYTTAFWIISKWQMLRDIS